MNPPTTDPIPLVDLAAQHREVADEVAVAFDAILASTAFIGGPDVGAFEAEFAAYCGVPHCVGVANGTDAIELMLRASGIGRGDEVIVPANTFIATAEAVARAGADIALVDCDPVHYLIDPERVAARLGPRTRAVIGVDLYGQMAPFVALRGVCAAGDIVLLEDAAQSQGATHYGRGIGAHVAAASTSFYPGKNLGAYGDAGAVVTTSEHTARHVRAVSNHGGLVRYEHDLIGCNARLDTLQAAVLRAKLRRLAKWNAARRDAASRYDSLLADLAGVVRPSTAAGNEHVWHLYVVQLPNRDVALKHLNAHGIGAGIHYPNPLHRTGAFAHLGLDGEFPVAEATAGSILTLPLYPHITAQQQERVVRTLAEVLP